MEQGETYVAPGELRLQNIVRLSHIGFTLIPPSGLRPAARLSEQIGNASQVYTQQAALPLNHIINTH